MSHLVRGIATVRNSICAIMRIARVGEQNISEDTSLPLQFNVSFVGTAWCVVPNRYFVTAYHVFNNGQPRDPNDRFNLFFVPNNGPLAFSTPITGFLLEDTVHDIGVIEISACPSQISGIPSLAVTFQNQPDGTEVLTYGFPSPILAAGSLDSLGNWAGGQMQLKTHANEGIIAGQYDINGTTVYELNVGWHHGESGGPIVRMDPVAVFALMQAYRLIQSPHGTFAGPHQGHSIEAIRTTLETIGAVIV